MLLAELPEISRAIAIIAATDRSGVRPLLSLFEYHSGSRGHRDPTSKESLRVDCAHELYLAEACLPICRHEDEDYSVDDITRMLLSISCLRIFLSTLCHTNNNVAR